MGIIVRIFIVGGSERIGVTAMTVSLANELTRATNDVANDVTTSLEAFAAEEASEDRQKAVLSCSSSTETSGLALLLGFLLLAVGGRPHGVHLH